MMIRQPNGKRPVARVDARCDEPAERAARWRQASGRTTATVDLVRAMCGPARLAKIGATILIPNPAL